MNKQRQPEHNAFQGKRIKQNRTKRRMIKRREAKLQSIGLSLMLFVGGASFNYHEYLKVRAELKDRPKSVKMPRYRGAA